MTKWLLSVLILLIIPAVSFCQQPIIELQHTGGTLFLSHTVAPKENFYSVGRLYNVSPRELASFNHVSMDNGLAIGQQLRIPLDKNNFTQSASKNAAEALVPLYHIVLPDENLFRIGMNFKNVPVNALRKWNHLQSDQLNKGMPLIVGYLKVNKSESALSGAKFTLPNTTPANQTVSVTSSPVEKTDVQKPEPKKEAVSPTQPTVVAPPAKAPTDGKEANEGFFKNEFMTAAAAANVESANIMAAVFKSTSGWQDAKFYCFNNNAAPGSIIKISIPASGKSVYAKVLDAIPDIKQNEGVQLVLSNAAASSLGVTDEKFESTISFVK